MHQQNKIGFPIGEQRLRLPIKQIISVVDVVVLPGASHGILF